MFCGDVVAFLIFNFAFSILHFPSTIPFTSSVKEVRQYDGTV